MPNHFDPSPSEPALRNLYVGKSLGQVNAPAAILDRAIVKRNCGQMLDACRSLRVGFRAHVKTHKTTEITQMQVGSGPGPVSIVISTIAEAEHLLEYLCQCKRDDRSLSVLYGIPLPPSRVQRLGELGQALGPGSISVLIDHPGQLDVLPALKEAAGFTIGLFVKVDTGYHRAGLKTNSSEFAVLVDTLLNHVELAGWGELRGFYSHAGHSYGGDSEIAAMDMLVQEIGGLQDAAKFVKKKAANVSGSKANRAFVLSVGATPTATSIQNILRGGSQRQFPEMRQHIARLCRIIEEANEQDETSVELHAGVYTLLDMQQLATRARPSATSTQHAEEQPSPLSTSDVALTILAEIASLYPARDPPEALIAAGSLALGREPCMSYTGWGVVSDWGLPSQQGHGDRRSGWEVGRISQEHGILRKDTSSAGIVTPELEIGRKVRIWPNHACIAGAGFGWYLVVDSTLPEGRQDEIVDVWVRCRGW
ncbi:MAG: hypothetical protein FRX48_02872 [Lasallia pustulata]|uniref:D-serine dehydratase n=1 Tax=Lasallia pustulata TaxID=136370 RepID=A0A5M8PU35_9LECA|nr:MAG: hypothetical protein FRX48_02872 [Lasallia pustulata]